MATIGIIGGSGFYSLPGLSDTRWVTCDTPWGSPSDDIFIGEMGDVKLCFLPRHGRGHRIAPSDINYRANIHALKSLGVTDVVSLSAVGTLREGLPPGTFVVVDQFIDRTFARATSYFGTGLVAHVSMAHPVCGRLGAHIGTALSELQVPHQLGGTYLAMEGPQFSTLAESALYRQWAADVIGMTNMPEAKLAREAELCYATIAMVTDFDCWHPQHEAVTVEAIVKVMSSNTSQAQDVVTTLAKALGHDAAAHLCPCRRALENAVMTAPAERDGEMIERLKVVAGRVLG